MLKPRSTLSDDGTKKPNQKMTYTMDQLTDMTLSESDPLHFMRSHMKVQEPMKGTIPFEPWPFQVKIIEAFHKNRNTVALTARQMGKSCTYETVVNNEGTEVSLGSLVPLRGRARVVSWLERMLVRLAHNH